MIIYKNILEKLASSGWTAYQIQRSRILSTSTMDRLRHNSPISTLTLDTICKMCSCQPGDLLEWVPDENPEE